MKILRRYDRRPGWAFQMAGRWTLDGHPYAAGSWLIELEGGPPSVLGRFAVTSARLREHYMPSTARDWPPFSESASGVFLLDDWPTHGPTARTPPDRP
jgi:hypothetical protein